jgi:exonuclease VII large subunit
MIKHRYDMKRLLTKQQQERIKSLEDMIEHLHESFESLKKNTSADVRDAEKLFEKYCYKSIVDSQRLVAESKKNMQEVEKKATESFKRESQKWMDLLTEHKENYERELNRKQAEVIRLNELLGKWINKYMELQEGISGTKPLSIMYYSQIQDIIRETLSSPFERCKEKSLTPKAKPNSVSQKFMMNSGDVSSPLG